jgi:hypothetical protein
MTLSWRLLASVSSGPSCSFEVPHEVDADTHSKVQIGAALRGRPSRRALGRHPQHLDARYDAGGAVVTEASREARRSGARGLCGESGDFGYQCRTRAGPGSNESSAKLRNRLRQGPSE